MTTELLSDAEVLFAEGLPVIDTKHAYSLAWTGWVERDDTI